MTCDGAYLWWVEGCGVEGSSDIQGRNESGGRDDGRRCCTEEAEQSVHAVIRYFGTIQTRRGYQEMLQTAYLLIVLIDVI